MNGRCVAEIPVPGDDAVSCELLSPANRGIYREFRQFSRRDWGETRTREPS